MMRQKEWQKRTMNNRKKITSPYEQRCTAKHTNHQHYPCNINAVVTKITLQYPHNQIEPSTHIANVCAKMK
jgi:hypothetical protein